MTWQNGQVITQEILENNIYDYGLWDLNRILVGLGRSFADFLLISLP